MMKKVLLNFAVAFMALLVSSTAWAASDNEILLKRDAPLTLSRMNRAKVAKSMKAPARVVGNGETVIRTAMLMKDSWIENQQYQLGMYEYPLSGYESRCLQLNSNMDPTGGATYIGDDKYFLTSYSVYAAYNLLLVNHYIFDTNTWTTVSESTGTGENIARDLAFDHISGKLYGCFRGDDGTTDYYVFGSLDIDDLDSPRTVIAKLDNKGWNALSVDRFGNLYAIDREGALLKVDKGSGATTKIGNTGLTSQYQTSGAIDQETDLFYYVTCNNNGSSLYAIDLTTAKAEKIYDMADGEQVAGMYVPTAKQTDVTLSAAAGLAASIDDASLSGILTFTSPETYSDGSSATGELSYKVICNGKTIGEGTSTCGSRVIVPVTLEKSGSYVFIVTVSNDKGQSPEAYLEKYIGYDVPEAVTNVEATYLYGRFIISWEPSVKGVYGGTFNKDDVTYTVVRMPDAVTVEKDTKSTNVMDMVAETTELVNYSYVVTPHHHDAVGASTSSEKILLGAKLPPYEVKFATNDDLENITITDANNDGRYWRLDSDEGCLWLYPTSVTLGDDYIFSVPLQLEAGQLYKFTAEMGSKYAQYGNKERFDAFLATSPTPEGCTVTLIEPLTISTARDEYSAVFKVETSGKYYVAIHGCSDPDSFGMFAYGMSVKPDASLDSPDAPVLSALADINGGNNVEIAVTAPSKLLNGDVIESVTKMELYRDDVLLTTFDKPELGKSYTYSDKEVAEGLHTYSARAFNEAGGGQTAYVKAFVGINIPGTPVNVVAKELSDCRSVEITWKAPETDIDGCPINPEFVTYTVAYYDGNVMRWKPIAENVKNYSFTTSVDVAPGTQTLLKFGVYASTAKGANTVGVGSAPIIAVGDAYEMPYVETFGGNSLTGILGEENENDGASWQVWFKDGTVDGDGRCLFYSGAIDKKGSMFTGKIHITGKNPAFSFWYWSIPTSPDEEVVVEVNDGTGYKQVGVTPMNRGGDEQHWEKYTVSLKDYIGMNIQIRLSYIIRKYVLYVDFLRISDTYQDNLSANSIFVPTKMDPGTASLIEVVVENTGEQTSRDYDVDLYINDIRTNTLHMSPLAAGKKASSIFEYVPGVLDSKESVVYAVIDYQDENTDDNMTGKKTSMVLHREYPVVTDLKATRKGNDILLEWSDPQLNGGDVTVTDDAEGYVPFSTGFSSSVLDNDYVGDWTMYDGDGEGSNGLAGFPHDNITVGAELSFIVFNPAEMGIVASGWQPRSGNQAFVCLVAPESPNDDWMISPRLSGNAQTVTFYAKSVGDEYYEQFEFLYSTEGNDIDSFVKVKTIEKVPAQWTEYSFDLPKGACHFAIRCISNRQFALFVDDITFERANPAAGLEISGYNIYRDGVKLNQKPVSGNTFTDTDDKAHTYVVTTVYDRGESTASNNAIVGDLSSIDNPDSDSVTITAGQGQIIVRNAEGELIRVFGTDGKAIARATGSDTTVIDVAPGIYVVRVAAKSALLVVK